MQSISLHSHVNHMKVERFVQRVELVSGPQTFPFPGCAAMGSVLQCGVHAQGVCGPETRIEQSRYVSR